MPRLRDDQFLTDLGNRLRARRQFLGLKLSDVGEVCEIAPQQVSKYEQAVNDPPSSTLLRLAKALKTSTGALLGEAVTAAADKRANAQAAALFADKSVASILRRLQAMDEAARKQAHALIVAADIRRQK
jgi:transcriptional regulator with XRE-family HTH domain